MKVRPELVYLEWVDHCSHDGGHWSSVKEVKKLKPNLCGSVGFIINESDAIISIASHIGLEADDKEISGDLCIIKSCITKRATLCPK